MTREEQDRYLSTMLNQPVDGDKGRVPPDVVYRDPSQPVGVVVDDDIGAVQTEADVQARDLVEDQAASAVAEGEVETSDRVIEREQVVTNPETGERVIEKQTTVIPSAERLRTARANRTRRVVYYITRVFTIILIIRFILRLFGANPDNGFTNFWYTISAPIHYPFRNIFGYEPSVLTGSYVFEVSSLFAIGIYWLLAYIIARGVMAFTNRSVLFDSRTASDGAS
jgi:YggT family protein